MDLNYILFPAPKPSYSIESLRGKLIWVPKYKSKAIPSTESKANIENRRIASVSFGSPLLQSKAGITVTSPRHKPECKTIENDDGSPNARPYKMATHSGLRSTNNSVIPVQKHEAKKTRKTNIPVLELDLAKKDIDSISTTTIPEEDVSEIITERLEMGCMQGIKPQIPKITFQGISSKQTKSKKPKLTLPLDLLATSKQEACNRSQSDFDPTHTDEYNETQVQLTSPRTFHKYISLALSNPLALSSPTSGTNMNSTNTQQNVNSPKYFMSNRTLVFKAEPVKELAQCLSARGELKAPKPTNSIMLSPQQGRKAPMKERAADYIPCLLLKPMTPSDKILIYFHGNAEDINLSQELLGHLGENLAVNILAMEYPGYGLYKGLPNDANIMEDAEALYDFLTTRLKVNPRNIIAFGRSIGSGPATHLASKREIGALVLMSAFTSIRGAVKDFAGKIAQYLVKERFNNLEAISKVRCPTFIVHGQKDTLVPFNHSEELHRACGGPSELVLPKGMDHIEFDFDEDFTDPLFHFLVRCGIIDHESEIGTGGKIVFPKVMFLPPEKVLEQINQTKEQPKKRERNLFAKSVDMNALKENEFLSSKLAKRSIVGF